MLLGWVAVLTVTIHAGAAVRGEVGYDYGFYVAVGRHFLETGQAYFPSQSAPYIAEGMVNIYPPTALYLFVPFVVLPAVLWWAVPLGIIASALYRLRPARWAWPVMALACCVPINAPAVPVALVYGNTLLWTVAAIFGGAAFRPGLAWAGIIKPTDLVFGLPFALRSWRGFAVTVVASVALLPLWFDYIAALGNLVDGGLLRGMSAWAALAIPLVAWVARTGRSLPARGRWPWSPLRSGPASGSPPRGMP